MPAKIPARKKLKPKETKLTQADHVSVHLFYSESKNLSLTAKHFGISRAWAYQILKPELKEKYYASRNANAKKYYNKDKNTLWCRRYRKKKEKSPKPPKDQSLEVQVDFS